MCHTELVKWWLGRMMDIHGGTGPDWGFDLEEEQ